MTDTSILLNIFSKSCIAIHYSNMPIQMNHQHSFSYVKKKWCITSVNRKIYNRTNAINYVMTSYVLTVGTYININWHTISLIVWRLGINHVNITVQITRQKNRYLKFPKKCTSKQNTCIFIRNCSNDNNVMLTRRWINLRYLRHTLYFQVMF